MNSMRKRFLGGAALACIVAAGCSSERAITTEPVGDLGFGQNLAKISTNLPRGRVNFTSSLLPLANPAADTLVLNFAGLDSLTAGSYVVWVANDSGTKFARATGTMTITTTDTTLNAAGDPVFSTTETTVNNVESFQNGGPNKRFRFSALRSQIAGLAATDSLASVIISIESGAGGSEPDANRRPLWARRSQRSTAAATLNVAAMRFGNYAPRVLDEYVYALSTTALVPTATNANIPRGRIEVRGSIFTVNDSNYYRPPQGYYYEAWAIRTDTLGQFVDTISLGVKASPFPRRISFFTADMTIPDPISMYSGTAPGCEPTTSIAFICPNREPVIFAAQHRVVADTVAAASAVDGVAWKHFAWTYVTLQNKAAPENRMGGVVIMNVNNPGSISGF